MEVLLIIMGIIFAIAFLLEKLSDFVRQLKTSGSARLSNGFAATLSVVPIHKESEDSPVNKSSPNDKLE